MFEDHIAKLVPKLAALRMDPAAVPSYDLMSGALVWSDEKLSGLNLNAEELGCLRGILRFRSSLITGEPDARFQDLWKLLQEKCPTWIGFNSSRCAATQELLELHNRLKKTGR